MAETISPADKSFSVVIARLLDKATPGTPRLACQTCVRMCRMSSIN